jgi:deazaflavin-dependent oxidoreductase (nitroreductase family)
MPSPPAVAKYFNRVAVRMAGHRLIPLWALLRHRGRKSGKTYVTPIAVIPTATTFLIALPFGPGTDWVRNVRAAQGCVIRWKGKDHECSDPTLVGRDVAMAAARGVTRRVLGRIEFPHGFIQLQRAAA